MTLNPTNSVDSNIKSNQRLSYKANRYGDNDIKQPSKKNLLLSQLLIIVETNYFTILPSFTPQMWVRVAHIFNVPLQTTRKPNSEVLIIFGDTF